MYVNSFQKILYFKRWNFKYQGTNSYLLSLLFIFEFEINNDLLFKLKGKKKKLKIWIEKKNHKSLDYYYEIERDSIFY